MFKAGMCMDFACAHSTFKAVKAGRCLGIYKTHSFELRMNSCTRTLFISHFKVSVINISKSQPTILHLRSEKLSE